MDEISYLKRDLPRYLLLSCSTSYYITWAGPGSLPHPTARNKGRAARALVCIQLYVIMCLLEMSLVLIERSRVEKFRNENLVMHMRDADSINSLQCQCIQENWKLLRSASMGLCTESRALGSYGGVFTCTLICRST